MYLKCLCLMLQSYFSFKDVLPVNHAECFCCHFQYLVYFYSQFIPQIVIECLPFIKYCADQGLKETHMVPTVLKYGGFQFYSRWSKSTTTSFSLLMTQNWMTCKEQLPEDSESKQKQVDWEGESKLWRSISLALVALTWR